ncbi:MAG: hypothetical protein ABI644_08365 [Arenimonas sp.]
MKTKLLSAVFTVLCLFILADAAWAEAPMNKSVLCAIVTFSQLDTKTYEWKLRDVQSLREIVKTCDEGIKAMPGNSYKYYNRGMARYYLIRGLDQPFAKTASQAAAIDLSDLQMGQSDMQKFLMDEDSSKWPDERKWAFLASGEFFALSAFKEKKPELFQAALKQLDAGQQAGTMMIDKEIFNQRYVEARKIIESVLRKNAGNPANPSATSDVKERYQKYMADYAASEATYKKAVIAFQEAQKQQQASATADKTSICKKLAEMNSSYGSLKNVFAKISEMKNKSELNADPELVKRIEARESQQKTVQGQIDAAVSTNHCESPLVTANTLDIGSELTDDDEILMSAMMEMDDGKYQEAVNGLSAYIKKHPAADLAYAQRARAYLLLKKLDLALLDAEKTLSLAPKNYDGLNVRAIISNTLTQSRTSQAPSASSRMK